MLRTVLTAAILLVGLISPPRFASAQTVPLFDGAFHQAPVSASLASASADVNGDGRADLVAITSPIPGPLLGIFLGNGDGTFQPPIQLDLGEPVVALAAADVDSSGTVDLVTVGSSFGLSIRKGIGDGTFSSPQPVSIAPLQSSAVVLALGDVTGDGIPEIFLSDAGSKFQVFLNAGSGVFTAGPSLTLPGRIQGLAVARLDSDSLKDLVVASDAGGTSRVDTYRSLGSGNLLPVDERIIAGASCGLAVADFNGDGIGDVAAAPLRLPQISVLFGTGDGHLSPSSEYNAGGGIIGFVLADQNGDGNVDLIAAHENLGVSVFLGAGGTFASPKETIAAVAIGNRLQGIAADFDGDGRLDVLFGPQLYLSHGDGTFGLQAAFQAGQPRFASGDLTGDGLADIAILDFDAATLSVFAGAGDGTFALLRSCPTVNPSSLALGVGDVDGDGIDDAVVATVRDDGTSDLATFFGGPSPTDCRAAHTIIAGGIGELHLLDLDGDGREDLISLGGGLTVEIWRALSDGTFQLETTRNTLADPAELRIADLDHDGLPDIVVANKGSAALSVYRGLGGFGFSTPTYDPTGQGPEHVVLSDFDGDTHPDVIVHVSGGSQFMRGDGTGAFASPVAMTEAKEATAGFVAADFDGDGITDLAVSNAPYVEMWHGNGNATFRKVESVGPGGIFGLSALDIDRNSTPDLLTGYSLYVTTIPNRSPAPPLPQISSEVDALPQSVSIHWQGTLGAGVEGRVFRKQSSGEWEPRATVTSGVTGAWAFEDATVQPGQSYDYDLRLSGRAVSTVSVQTPASPVSLAFDLVAPNPSRGAASVTFSLPRAQEAWLNIFDAKGRGVWAKEVGSLGPGVHTVELGIGASWQSGVYRVRLAQGDLAAVKTLVLLR